MARIRTIKPEFFTDSKIVKLTPLARLFYVSLWCEADKQGRLRWDPDTYKLRYLPADKVKITDLADELQRGGLIRLYEVDGQTYADIPSFTKNQVINNRESESTLPPFSLDATLTRESGVKAEGRKEGKEGKEGTPPVVPQGGPHSQEFEIFWSEYPSKVGKDYAWKCWRKRDDRPDLQTILAALKRYKATKPDDREWCNPSKWINQGRWQDGVEATTEAIQPADPNAQWRTRLTTWAKSPKPAEDRFWLHDWGPPPHVPGTKVPPVVLKEFGLAA